MAQDAFFTGRNQFDEQVEHFDPQVAETLVEASVRRMVEVNGPLATAIRVQRIADICAGAHVLPIDHWNQPEPESQKPQPTPPKQEGDRGELLRSPPVVLLLGWVLGAIWWGMQT